MPGLEGRFNPDYPPYDLNIPDNTRVDVWLKEFREFEANGDLPRSDIIRLATITPPARAPGARRRAR